MGFAMGNSGRWLAACVLLWSGQALAQTVTPAGQIQRATVAPVAVTQDIPFAPAHDTIITTQSAPNAWGGERTGSEPTLSDRVVSYTIDAELDAARHAVTGKEHMTWRNRSDREVRSVYFHLYLNAFQNEGSTFFTEREVLTAHGSARGNAVLGKGQWGWIRLQNVQQNGTPLKWRFVHPDGGPATDETVVRIDLAQPVPAGGTLALDIDFLSQLPRVVERTGWWGDFNLVGQWFPKIGVLELPGERGATEVRWNVHEFHFNSEFYADFGLYDVHLTVPNDYTVGAVGKLQGAPEQNNGKTTYHFMQGDVHDFAWVAAKNFKTLDGTYEGPGSPKVTVRVIYPPEYVASAAPTLKSTIDAIGYFSRTLGPYPYETVTAVVPPYNADEAGGMEYPTFFTSEGYKEIKPDTMNQMLSDFVNIHEFGHGYFYGILASNEFEEPILDEGLNEYWDNRMLRERKQDLVLATPFTKWLGITPHVSGFAFERFTATLLHPADPLAQNSWDRLSGTSYGTVYSRTATAMHDLEERLGRPALEKAFKLYYQRWRFRHPSVADFRAALIDSSGNAKDVDAIFNEYVYGTASMDDKVADIDSYEVLPQAGVSWKDGKRVEVDAEDIDKQVDKQRSAWEKAHKDAKPGAPGPFPWHSTVTVRRYGVSARELLRVTFEDGTHQDITWNDDRRWARFDFVKPSKVVSAELDPDQHHLLDRDRLNNSLSIEPNGAASRRWTADAAALLQSISALLSTL
ncbi:MAG TPA: M1 family metallopeptidase [Dyella sp.]|uniref:M1 family metallopeptidase n=1 Tax=Dyella sp. TaxID=1869338 RepID=UPI002C7E40EE|nr:M1 family metallopeptidase [Dyella sp.]HUB88591.1 M1 family metallopeptidase [Dyella sp.]